MVASRRLLRLNRLLLNLPNLNRHEDLHNLCKAFHALELLLAIYQHGP